MGEDRSTQQKNRATIILGVRSFTHLGPAAAWAESVKGPVDG